MEKTCISFQRKNEYKYFMVTRLNRITCFCALLINITAIILYLLIHGTKNLFIVWKINSIVSFIPVFDGIKCANKFIKGYFVDILWFNSFCIFFMNYKNIKYYCILLIIASILEIAQYSFKYLGTFDVIDMVIYLSSTFVYILIMYISNLFVNKSK